MKIGAVDTRDRVYVIAEVGNNHEGDLELARRMVRLAADAGADAVKFQSIRPERLTSALETARIEQLRRICLKPEAFAVLAADARAAGIDFMSTPFDPDFVRELAPLMPAVKIASGDNDHWPLIRAAAQTGLPLIVSTGLIDLKQAKAIVDFVRAEQKGSPADKLALLHCVASYPAQPQDVRLCAIRELEALGVTAGYSDHTLGIEAAVAAVAAGARVIEKHFTIDKNHSAFRDHQLSADPADLKELVQRIRRTEILLGHPGKKPVDAEQPMLTAARRGLSARRALEAGKKLEPADLDWTRPRRGMAPGNETLVVGRKLGRALAAGDPITPDALTGE